MTTQSSFGGVGALCKFAIGQTGATITRMDALGWLPQSVKTLSDGSVKAMRGTLDHQSTSVAEGILHVRFRTQLWLTSAKMNVLLLSLGFTQSSTTFTLTDSLLDSTIIIGPAGGTKEHTFGGCVPTDWIVSGTKGSDPVMIDIGWIGRTWTTQTAGTFFTSQSSPAMTEGYVYPFGQKNTGGNNSVLTVLGATFGFPTFRLSLDYHIASEFNNSLTATNLMPTDHELKFATSALYNPADTTSSTASTEALLDTPLSGDVSGASLTLNFQRLISAVNYQTQFVVANAKLLARGPAIKKNDFNRLPINCEGYAIGSTPLLVVTNV